VEYLPHVKLNVESKEKLRRQVPEIVRRLTAHARRLLVGVQIDQSDGSSISKSYVALKSGDKPVLNNLL
jgi:hypothetical protein